MANRTSKKEQLLSLRQKEPQFVAQLLRAKGMLSTHVACNTCGIIMQERNHAKHIDGAMWVCYNRACSNHKNTKSIREGSFFYGLRLSLADIWSVIVRWTYNEGVKAVAEEYGMHRSAVGRIYAKLQQYCSKYLAADPIRLGGPGIICQVDESLFCHKQKFGKGRQPEREVWVFGIADTSVKPARFYMEMVDNRSAEILLPIIKKVCKPGTIIHSDKWAAYRRINSQLGFEHGTVNHYLNFVDPVSGVHTQNIESRWCVEKAKIKRQKGLRRSAVPAFLDEIMFKDMARKYIWSYMIVMLKAD